MLAPNDDRKKAARRAIEAGLAAALPGLHRYAQSLTRGRRADAEDLVQEAVCLVLEHAEQFEPGTNLGAWLSVILFRRHCTAWRRAQRTVSYDPTSEENEDYAGLAVDGEAVVVARIDCARVLAKIAELEPRHRRVLEALAGLGLTVQESAELFGVAEGTAKSQLYRARARLSGLAPGWSDRAARRVFV